MTNKAMWFAFLDKVAQGFQTLSCCRTIEFRSQTGWGNSPKKPLWKTQTVPLQRGLRSEWQVRLWWQPCDNRTPIRECPNHQASTIFPENVAPRWSTGLWHFRDGGANGPERFL